MKAALAILVFLLGSSGIFAAQSQAEWPQPADLSAAADRLGLTCERVLQFRSSEWVEKFHRVRDKNPQGTLRALAAYARCYDARTNRLVETLARKGTGPLLGAATNFSEFEQRLVDFTAQALAAADPPADMVKSAFAGLYEKQFRYRFYLSYAHRQRKPSPATPEEVQELARAKNRLGELLSALPDAKARDVHAAFGEILGSIPVSDPIRLDVYRHAIFLLEPPSAPPFSPPPF